MFDRTKRTKKSASVGARITDDDKARVAWCGERLGALHGDGKPFGHTDVVLTALQLLYARLRKEEYSTSDLDLPDGLRKVPGPAKT